MMPAYKYTEITSKDGNTSFILLQREKPLTLLERLERIPVKTKAKIFQRFLGITAITIGIMELVAGYKGFIDEGGLFLIALPLGFYLATTKHKCYNNRSGGGII